MKFSTFYICFFVSDNVQVVGLETSLEVTNQAVRSWETAFAVS